MHTLFKSLDAMRDQVIDLQKHLVAIPALGPDNGGDGELEKTRFLREYLENLGITRFEEINAPDSRVSAGYRPNLAAVIPGRDASRTLWVISHTDVVPPGDPALWQSDPWTLRVEGDAMFGRGVEDNHQGIVSSCLLARALVDTGVTPPMNFGLLLVADEETASAKGLDYVVKTRPDLFGPDDLILVPDFGAPDSTMVEVAEKHMLWVRISVHGKQCHGSTPEQGINSLVGAAAFILALRGLHERFPKKDALFDPPHSTFEATRKEANVPNVNTIPGLDVFYMDCRVLADYALDDVLAAMREIGEGVSREYGVRMEYEIVQRGEAAPATPPDSPVVERLIAAIKEVYATDAKPAGIGGGTVAAFLRKRGHKVAVWATCVHNAHQPNESSLISSQIGDAKVMAHVLMAG